eukprot:COSAG06_NODE_34261_length_477_cov_0.904762_2_plen_38_part_01
MRPKTPPLVPCPAVVAALRRHVATADFYLDRLRTDRGN